MESRLLGEVGFHENIAFGFWRLADVFVIIGLAGGLIFL
jgi:hypothetical protein